MKKYKISKSKRNGAAILMLVYPFFANSMLMDVHDASSFTQLIKIFNATREQTSKIDGQTSELVSMNSMIGDYANNDVLAEHSSSITNLLYKATGEVDSFTWSLQSIAENPLDPNGYRNFQSSYGNVASELFTQKDKNNNITWEEVDRVKEKRHDMATESLKSSMALSQTEQAKIPEIRKEVIKVSKRAATSQNLHEDLHVNNQIGQLILNELIEIRVLLAKKLELDTTLAMKSHYSYDKPMKAAKKPKRKTKARPRVKSFDYDAYEKKGKQGGILGD